MSLHACLCGCGAEVDSRHKYLRGHVMKDYPERHCECGCGQRVFHNQDGRDLRYFGRHSSKKGKKCSPETVARMKAAWDDPDVRSRRSEGIRRAKKEKPNDMGALQQAVTAWRDHLSDDERILRNKQNSDRCKKQYADGRAKLAWCHSLSDTEKAAVQRKMSTSAMNYYSSLSETEKKEVNSRFSKVPNWWKTASEADKNDQRARRSARVRAYYANLNGEERAVRARHARVKASPNKLELLFDALTPDNVVFVGNRKFWVKTELGPKNPDFIIRPFTETRKVIEVFGDYWHRDDNVDALKTAYMKAGVSCLVVWESEIRKSPNTVQEKVAQFLEGPL